MSTSTPPAWAWLEEKYVPPITETGHYPANVDEMCPNFTEAELSIRTHKVPDSDAFRERNDSHDPTGEDIWPLGRAASATASSAVCADHSPDCRCASCLVHSPDCDVSSNPVISCDRKDDATDCDGVRFGRETPTKLPVGAPNEHPAAPCGDHVACPECINRDDCAVSQTVNTPDTGNIAWVYLGNGAYTQVDDSDYDIVGCHRWRLSSYGYAVRHAYTNGRRTTRHMHADILGVEPGGVMQIDHANRDRLDNRRANLRVCSHGQNMQNRRPLAAHGYKGVCHRKDGCWQAAFRPNGRQVHLGRFDNPVDAALAYDVAAIAEYGEFAWTNYLVAP